MDVKTVTYVELSTC